MKKNIPLVLISIALLFGLSSCKKKDQKVINSDVFTPLLDTQKEVSINVLGSYGNFEALEKVINDFNEFYPNVSINYEFTNNVHDAAMNRCAAKDDIDIIFFCSLDAKEKYKDLAEKYLVDINETNIDLSVIDQRILNTTLLDGKLYFLPSFLQGQGFTINTSLLEKYNLPVPTNLVEFEKVCDSLLAEGITPIYGTSGFAALLFFNKITFEIINSENSEEIIAQMNKGILSGEVLEDSLALYKKWVEKGYFDFSGNNLENNYSAYIMRFLEGDIPILASSTDILGGIRKREAKSKAFTEKPFKYEYLPTPFGESGFECLLMPSLLFGICKISNNLDYDIEFIRFLYTKEEIKDLISIKGMPGSYRHTGDSRLTRTENLKEEEIYYLGENGMCNTACHSLFYGLSKNPLEEDYIKLTESNYNRIFNERREMN